MATAKNLLVHVGGARGVGKSAVLEHMHRTVTVGLPLVIIPASAFVQELGKERFDRDWGALTIQEKEGIRMVFVDYLKQFSLGICVLDSHYIDVSPSGGIRPIVPHDLYPLIHCHIVVDCSDNVLLARRKSDLLKTRSLNKMHIERERRGELAAAQIISQATYTPLHVVPNERDVGYAAELLGAIIIPLWQTSLSSPETPPR